MEIMMKETLLKLMVENDFNDYDIVTEANDAGFKQMKLVGPYIVANKLNGNDRLYPLDDMRTEVTRFINEMVKTNRALGELEHPEYTHINPAEAAIRITKLNEEKDDEGVWIGESIILASDQDNNIKGTPKGDILASLVQHGSKIGFSTRGVGKLVQEKWGNKKESVVRNYRMSTVDCVVNPSIGQFVDGILESKNFMVDIHGDILEVNYNIVENGLSNLPKKQRSEYIFNLMNEFLKSL
jgi:hypothetical protein